MCGLAGLYNFRSLVPGSLAAVERMTRLLCIADKASTSNMLWGSGADRSAFLTSTPGPLLATLYWKKSINLCAKTPGS